MLEIEMVVMTVHTLDFEMVAKSGLLLVEEMGLL
jgi:hypothetical protein